MRHAYSTLRFPYRGVYSLLQHSKGNIECVTDNNEKKVQMLLLRCCS